MFTYFLLLGLFDLVKAKVKFFGAKCVYNSECSQNSGLNCALEDKLFNAQRICRCSEDFSWKQNQCVNEGIELINTQLLGILVALHIMLFIFMKVNKMYYALVERIHNVLCTSM